MKSVPSLFCAVALVLSHSPEMRVGESAGSVLFIALGDRNDSNGSMAGPTGEGGNPAKKNRSKRSGSSPGPSFPTGRHRGSRPVE